MSLVDNLSRITYDSDIGASCVGTNPSGTIRGGFFIAVVAAIA
jgi:hypothetical protein